MSYRIEYRGVEITGLEGQEYTFDIGTPPLAIIGALPGTVEYRPPTPQERFEDICKEIREQRYVLLRDPNEHEYWD